MAASTRNCSTGFTLIELLIVITIMLALTSIIAPSFSGMDMESKIAVANVTVKNVQKKISEYKELNGSWPTEVDPNWFIGNRFPRSPFAPSQVVNTININDSPAKWHPGYKDLEIYPPFWYCRGNGSFRIRVPKQATDRQTIELYNAANQSNVTSLGDQSY